MDSNVNGKEDPALQSARRVIDALNGQCSTSAARRYDTTSRVFATQEETLRGRFREATGKKT